MQFIKKIHSNNVLDTIIYTLTLSGLFILLSDSPTLIRVLIWCTLFMPTFLLSKINAPFMKKGIIAMMIGISSWIYFHEWPVLFLTLFLIYFFYQKNTTIQYKSIFYLLLLFILCYLMDLISASPSSLFLDMATLLVGCILIKILWSIFSHLKWDGLKKLKFISLLVTLCTTLSFLLSKWILPILHYGVTEIFIFLLKGIMTPIIAIFPEIRLPERLDSGSQPDIAVHKQDMEKADYNIEKTSIEKVMQSDSFSYILVFLMIVIAGVIIYIIWKKIKSVEDRKIPKNLFTEVFPFNSLSPNLSKKFTKQINQVLDQLFIVADKKGYPKKQAQSVRDWCCTVDFVDTASWLAQFENIRYSHNTGNEQHIEEFLNLTKDLIRHFENK